MSDGTPSVKLTRATPNRRADERRTMLVRATIRAIRKYGPDVAMDHIAAEANVSKPILYRHFRDKGDLYMAVSEHATQNMRTALLAHLEQQGDLRTLLQLVIDTYLAFIEEEPELYRFVVRRSFPDRPVGRDPVTTNNELLAGTLGQVIRDRLDALGMDSGGAATWAHAGVGMVQAAGDWWLEHRPLTRVELRDYLLMMVCGALEGILRAGGSPARMLGAPGPAEYRPDRA